MKSDSKVARTLFRKLFTDDEIVRGNLTGGLLRGQKLSPGQKLPEKYDSHKIEFIYSVCRSRLVTLSSHMPVSLERMERQVFKNYIRDAGNPVKRAAANAQRTT